MLNIVMGTVVMNLTSDTAGRKANFVKGGTYITVISVGELMQHLDNIEQIQSLFFFSQDWAG